MFVFFLLGFLSLFLLDPSPKFHIFYYLTSTKLYKLISNIPISITSIYLSYHKHQSFCPAKLEHVLLIPPPHLNGCIEYHSIYDHYQSPILSYFSIFLSFDFTLFQTVGSRDIGLSFPLAYFFFPFFFLSIVIQSGLSLSPFPSPPAL